MTRTALYRFFDGNDVLLYVGITEDVETRWNNHSRKRWWPDVAKKSVEWFDERPDAEAAEKRAIIGEYPLYNVVHSPKPRTPTKTAEPTAGRFYAVAIAQVEAQGHTVASLAAATKISRHVIEGWRTETATPKVYPVMTIADALGIDRDTAAELSGLPEDDWASLSKGSLVARDASDIQLLMEAAKRILGTTDAVEVAVQFMRLAGH